MRKICSVSLTLAGLLFAGVLSRCLAQTESPAPKELVQYVQDARRLGLKDPQIQANAVGAGWTEATVVAALKLDKPAVANTVAPVTATPAVNQPAAPQPAATPRGSALADDYRIGAGDVLQVSVWKEPDASVPSVVVRPDGRIAMPLLKEIDVVGLTPREAEKAITERLSQFINGVDVTVVVTEINSKKVYLIGAVKKEGPIPYTYRMSVMQAISEAGGLTDYAKRKKIYVLRKENGKDYRLPFNYEEVLKGERMEQNVQMLPNDTIVVPH